MTSSKASRSFFSSHFIYGVLIGRGMMTLLLMPTFANATENTEVLCETILKNQVRDSRDTNPVRVDDLTPNESELEVLGRLSYALQKHWDKATDYLDHLIVSGTISIPPFDWIDSEISSHREDWERLARDKNIRGSVLRSILSKLKENLSSLTQEQAESHERTRHIDRPLLLGETWKHLDYQSKLELPQGDTFAFEVKPSASLYLLYERDTNKSTFIKWNRIKVYSEVTRGPFFLRTPDGSYITPYDSHSTLPDGSPEQAKKAVAAVERYRRSKLTSESGASTSYYLSLAGWVEFGQKSYLAVFSQKESDRVIFDQTYAFLPLDETENIVEIPSKSVSKQEFDLALLSFKNAGPEGRYGIWKTEQGFWIYDFETKKQSPLFANMRLSDQWVFWSFKIIKIQSKEFLFVSWSGLTEIYDVSRFSNANSIQDFFVNSWQLDGDSSILRILSDNSGNHYVLSNKDIRRIDLISESLENSYQSLPVYLDFQNHSAESINDYFKFDHEGQSCFLILNHSRLIFYNGRSLEVSIQPTETTPYRILGVFRAHNSLVAVIYAMKNFKRVYQLYQLHGPEDSRLEDYKDLIPKLEAE